MFSDVGKLNKIVFHFGASTGTEKEWILNINHNKKTKQKNKELTVKS